MKYEGKEQETKECSKGKGKSKRNYKKRKKQDRNKQCDREAQGDRKEEFFNDPSWYFEDPVLADQLSSFSFNSFVGVPDTLIRPYYNPTEYNYSNARSMCYTNGIVVLRTQAAASTGAEDEISNGLTMAGRKIYTTLSSINAKTTQYTPNDLILLILALGSVIEQEEHIRRVFGTPFTFSTRNRLVPETLIESMGVEYDDFIKNLADYRIQFNTILVRLNRIPFMSNIAWFTKCARMYNTIYADSTSDMAQIVIAVPHSHWVIDESASETGTKLRAVINASHETPKKMSVWLKELSDMVTALSESTTLNYVYSDVINYCDKSGATRLVIPLVEEGYAAPYEYNIHYLMQMHNASWYGLPTDSSLDVTANADGMSVHFYPELTQEYRIDTSKFGVIPSPFIGSAFLDCYTDKADVAQRIDYTRFTTLVKGTRVDNAGILTDKYAYDVIPDHFVINVSMVYTPRRERVDGFPSSGDPLTIDSNCIPNINMISLSNVEWGPLMYQARYAPGDDQGRGAYHDVQVLGNVNYHTWIDVEWYRRMADAAMLGLFELRNKNI